MKRHAGVLVVDAQVILDPSSNPPCFSSMPATMSWTSSNCDLISFPACPGSSLTLDWRTPDCTDDVCACDFDLELLLMWVDLEVEPWK